MRSVLLLATLVLVPLALPSAAAEQTFTGSMSPSLLIYPAPAVVTERYDLYRVALQPGDSVRVRLTAVGAVANDLDLFLQPPSALDGVLPVGDPTNVGAWEDAVEGRVAAFECRDFVARSTTHPSSAEAIDHVVPAGGEAGAWGIKVEGFVLAGASHYTLRVEVARNGEPVPGAAWFEGGYVGAPANPACHV